MSFRPTILAAFANTTTPEGYLPSLAKERDGIQSILKEDKSPFDAYILADAGAPEVWKRVSLLKNRLVAFHYGGHATGHQLLLMNGKGNKVEIAAHSLAGLLGTCPYLKLVFLNGCSTQAQVKALLAHPQISYVIATQRKIGDKLATQFSLAFYQALSDPQKPLGDIQAAYNSAQSLIDGLPQKVQIKAQSLRNFSWEGKESLLEDSWVLFSRESLTTKSVLIHSLIPFDLRNGSLQNWGESEPKYDIEPLLLPRVRVKRLDEQTKTPQKISQERLMDFLLKEDPQNPNKNFLLTGDGGTGKSTALKNLWKNQLDQEHILPLWIDLRTINLLQKPASSGWISQTLCAKFLNDQYSPIQLNKWIDGLGKDSPLRVLLLLNGLDEVNGSHIMGLEKDLFRNWLPQKGVICLISTRENPSILDKFRSINPTLLSLSLLQLKEQKAYLHKFGLSYPQDQTTRWPLLKNPMMLNHYVQTLKQEDTDNRADFDRESDIFPRPQNQDQLLWNFFERQIYNSIDYDENPLNLPDIHTEKDFIRWLFHFVIAHCGYFSLSKKPISISRITQTIKEEKDLLIQYLNSEEELNYPPLLHKIENFLKHLKNKPDFLDDPDSMGKLLALIPSRLPFVSESIQAETYEFDSRLYGRFFAAIHLINQLELPIPEQIRLADQGVLPQELYKHPLSNDVVQVVRSLSQKFPSQVIPFDRKKEEAFPETVLRKYIENLIKNLKKLKLDS